jgi:hypothetical protein
MGKQGIVFSGGNCMSQTEYIVARLNEVKPEMIEEATTKAREGALGKVKTAQTSRSCSFAGSLLAGMKIIRTSRESKCYRQWLTICPIELVCAFV